MPMKLIIQIPCYNEAETLSIALADLPRQVDGFDSVDWLIIDDGSSDRTVHVAQECGVDHIIRHTKNQGLAKAFMTGLDACLKLGADVIVNTDADNQYNAADIPALIRPIQENTAEIVVGARPIQEIGHFSALKKMLQRLGSWVVRKVSSTEIPDAPSGFRAFSKQAAMQLNVFNEYTYTLETIIQAGQKNMAITSVPVRVNEDLRPSRLFKSIPAYVQRSIMTIIRIFVIYKPFRFFSTIGLILITVGIVLGLRFLYAHFTQEEAGHIQSLILAAILIISGFQTILVAFLADVLAANRKMLEGIKYQLNFLRYEHTPLASNSSNVQAKDRGLKTED
ncbi:MAG: glycosyltransferase family 2 protein [Desulfovermiculus sp.]